MCWLFPNTPVRIDAPCLDCGLPVQVEMQDGQVITTTPESIMAYVAVPFARWMERLPHA